MQGADTSYVVDEKIIAAATKWIGAKPAFWGRYFKGPGNSDPVQYQPRKENAVFAAAEVPVLPIARQTSRVGGTKAQGLSDGKKNLAALVEAFGNDVLASRRIELLLFLDVEPETPLTRDYYNGWADAVTGTAAKIAPAIYLNKSDRSTWNSIKNAVQAGIPCAGLWVAHYQVDTGCCAAPAWRDTQVLAQGYKEAPAPLLGWQYCQECDAVDYSVVNPAQQDKLIAGLAVPRATAMTTFAAIDDTHLNLNVSAQPDIISAVKSILGDLRALNDVAGRGDQGPLFPNGIHEINVDLKLAPDIEARVSIKGPEATTG